jgi:hypothetical protein
VGVASVGSGHREGDTEKQLKEIDGIKHLLTQEEYAICILQAKKLHVTGTSEKS